MKNIGKIAALIGFMLLAYSIYEWYLVYAMHNEFFKNYKNDSPLTGELLSHITAYREKSGDGVIATMISLGFISFGFVWKQE